MGLADDEHDCAGVTVVAVLAAPPWVDDKRVGEVVSGAVVDNGESMTELAVLSCSSERLWFTELEVRRCTEPEWDLLAVTRSVWAPSDTEPVRWLAREGRRWPCCCRWAAW